MFRSRRSENRSARRRSSRSPGAAYDTPLRVLTFVADYAAKIIKPNLTRAEQVAFCATGTGVLGTSHEYLRNIVSQFDALGVVDEHCKALLSDVEAFMRATATKTSGASQ